ncbi:MAG: 3'-5' exonuclease [Bacteroidota bacterium]
MSNLRDILVLDIETVSGYPTFDEMPEGLKSHWLRKAGFLRNEDEKPLEELYFDRAGIYAEFGKIIVIAVGIFDVSKGDTALRVKSFHAHDEKSLLLEFVMFLRERFDQDRLTLCAHNGKEFDFPYLCRRLIIHGIPIPSVLSLSGKKPWEVKHIDTMEMWKFGDYKSFTSLDLLTHLLGISSSKSDMDGSKVNQVYHEEDGLTRIAEYCCQDVEATAQVYLKLNTLPTIPNELITRVP